MNQTPQPYDPTALLVVAAPAPEPTDPSGVGRGGRGTADRIDVGGRGPR
jgi:hypothetical protein